MNKDIFKHSVRQRVAEGHDPKIFKYACNDILGAGECQIFLANVAVNVKSERVGDELERLVKQLGLYGKDGCGCQCFINTMNSWGCAGCLINIKIIRSRLWSKLTVKGFLKAFYKSIRTGLIIRLGIVRPIHNLILLAIKRAQCHA